MKLILIVNDIALLESIKRLLEANNHIGVGYLLNKQYDVAIIDMHLDKISFKEIFDLITKHKINIKVLAITKKELLNLKLLNYEIVANEYLTLPFYSKELLDILDTMNIDSVNYEGNGFSLCPYYIKTDKGKRYLTKTECLVLDYLLNGNNLELRKYKDFVYKEKDLPIYVDSINNKLKELEIKIKIKIENDYYKVVNL